MRTQKNPVTLLIVFTIWLGLILGCSNSREATNSPSSEDRSAPLRISAEDLSKAYESNEAEADKLYQGKTLIVTGKVGTIDAKIMVVLLMDARQKPNILCGFAADQKGAVSKLEPGQMVTVKGECRGKGTLLGSVVLLDCVLQ
ncbi:MAG TPA: hypothetical protein VHE60_04275 [Pyrinomonadaceae bacterium]|nr:hypothetical protein [Pyrinomonadaceae bacterium]